MYGVPPTGQRLEAEAALQPRTSVENLWLAGVWSLMRQCVKYRGCEAACALNPQPLTDGLGSIVSGHYGSVPTISM